jgi:hypothetical protein
VEFRALTIASIDCLHAEYYQRMRAPIHLDGGKGAS